MRRTSIGHDADGHWRGGVGAALRFVSGSASSPLSNLILDERLRRLRDVSLSRALLAATHRSAGN